MALRSRIGGVLLGFSVVLVAGSLPSLAQDPVKEVATASPTKKSKVSTGPRTLRRVPPYFGKVGLTPDQKEKIYEIRGKHQAEIEALKAQIEEVGAKELIECEGVLLDSQKKVLSDLRATAKTSRKAK